MAAKGKDCIQNVFGIACPTKKNQPIIIITCKLATIL